MKLLATLTLFSLASVSLVAGQDKQVVEYKPHGTVVTRPDGSTVTTRHKKGAHMTVTHKSGNEHTIKAFQRLDKNGATGYEKISGEVGPKHSTVYGEKIVHNPDGSSLKEKHFELRYDANGIPTQKTFKEIEDGVIARAA